MAEALARKCSNRVSLKSASLWTFPGLGVAATSRRQASWAEVAIEFNIISLPSEPKSSTPPIRPFPSVTGLFWLLKVRNKYKDEVSGGRGISYLRDWGKGAIDKRMADICQTCGLPKDICVCGEISKNQQRIRVRVEKRKWNKPTTIIEGLDEKSVDLSKLTVQLKSHCACGGTTKNSQILLQGDHREKSKMMLVQLGFSGENIDIQ